MLPLGAKNVPTIRLQEKKYGTLNDHT